MCRHYWFASNVADGAEPWADRLRKHWGKLGVAEKKIGPIVTARQVPTQRVCMEIRAVNGMRH